VFVARAGISVRVGVYLRKSSLNVSYTFPRIHFVNIINKVNVFL
jgi:hypothetical protein